MIWVLLVRYHQCGALVVVLNAPAVTWNDRRNADGQYITGDRKTIEEVDMLAEKLRANP